MTTTTLPSIHELSLGEALRPLSNHNTARYGTGSGVSRVSMLTPAPRLQRFPTTVLVLPPLRYLRSEANATTTPKGGVSHPKRHQDAGSFMADTPEESMFVKVLGEPHKFSCNYMRRGLRCAKSYTRKDGVIRHYQSKYVVSRQSFLHSANVATAMQE